MIDRRTIVFGRQPGLVNPADQEDLVVRREAEQHREEHHRQERLDRPRPIDPEDPGKPSPLENRDEDALGRTNREQIHDRRLEGMRSERKTSMSSRTTHPDHDREEEGQSLRDPIAHVDEGRGRTADEPTVRFRQGGG